MKRFLTFCISLLLLMIIFGPIGWILVNLFWWCISGSTFVSFNVLQVAVAILWVPVFTWIILAVHSAME